MADYYTNTNISVPLYDSRLQVDVNLGGLKFSYDYGMFYEVTAAQSPVTLPSPFPTPGNVSGGMNS